MKFAEHPAPFPGQRLWGAKAYGRSYVVSYTPGLGYGASWNDCASLTPGPAKFLPNAPFASLRQAVAACRFHSRMGVQ